MSCLILLFKQNTSDDMRISYCSSDVCSSDLYIGVRAYFPKRGLIQPAEQLRDCDLPYRDGPGGRLGNHVECGSSRHQRLVPNGIGSGEGRLHALRSEEHTSELQSLMRISYAVFCLKKKNKHAPIVTITIKIQNQLT